MDVCRNLVDRDELDPIVVSGISTYYDFISTGISRRVAEKMIRVSCELVLNIEEKRLLKQFKGNDYLSLNIYLCCHLTSCNQDPNTVRNHKCT